MGQLMHRGWSSMLFHEWPVLDSNRLIAWLVPMNSKLSLLMHELTAAQGKPALQNFSLP